MLDKRFLEGYVQGYKTGYADGSEHAPKKTSAETSLLIKDPFVANGSKPKEAKRPTTARNIKSFQEQKKAALDWAIANLGYIPRIPKASIRKSPTAAGQEKSFQEQKKAARDWALSMGYLHE